MFQAGHLNPTSACSSIPPTATNRKHTPRKCSNASCREPRRPVRDEEISGKLELFRKVFAETGDFITAIKEPLVATLVSPQFLFLAEDSGPVGNPSPQTRRPRRSTMPDEDLLSLAARSFATKDPREAGSSHAAGQAGIRLPPWLHGAMAGPAEAR